MSASSSNGRRRLYFARFDILENTTKTNSKDYKATPASDFWLLLNVGLWEVRGKWCENKTVCSTKQIKANRPVCSSTRSHLVKMTARPNMVKNQLFVMHFSGKGLPVDDLPLKSIYCKTRFFAYPLFREFREPGKFSKITGRENLNTVAFQCSRKQKRQNYGVQNN